MKKIVSLILAFAFILGALAMTGCNVSKEVMPEAGEYTRIAISTDSSVESMELASSVEFIVDDTAHVVSAASLDENGSLLLAGETFEGMTPGEAVEHVIYTAIDLGFIVKSAVEGDQNSINILVSGASYYAEKLGFRLVNDAKILLSHLDIPGKVEAAADITIAELREMVIGCDLYTEEEVAQMDMGDLLIALAVSRKYAAPFLTEELRVIYRHTKHHKIELAKSRATANVISGLGDVYYSTANTYSDAVDYYSSTITAVEQFNYDTLVSPDSEYQKALAKLQEAKATYVSLRATLATVSGEDRVALEAELEAAEQMYNQTLTEIDLIATEANSTVTLLTNELTKAEAKLREIETGLFDYNIEAALQSKVTEIDAAANAAKDAFFADFEAKYGKDINNAVENLTKTKKTIVSAIDKTTAELTAKKNEISDNINEKYGDYITLVKNKLHTEFGDDLRNAKDSVENALSSAKEQLQDQLSDLLTPQPDPYK